MAPAPPTSSTLRVHPAVPVALVLLAFLAEELLGYQTLEDSRFLAGWGLSSYVVLLVVQIPIAAACFAFGPSLSRALYPLYRMSRSLIRAVSVCLPVLGCVLAVAPAATGGPAWLEIAGIAVLAIGAFALKVAVLGFLSQIPSRETARSIVVAVLLYPLLSFIVVLSSWAAWVLSAVSLAVGLLLAERAFGLLDASRQDALPVSQTRFASRSAAQSVDRSAARPRFSKPLVPLPSVMVGFCALCLCTAFLNPLHSYETIDMPGLFALTFGTHLGAALLLLLFVRVFDDPSHAYATKGACSIVLFAFVLLALMGPASLVPRVFCVTAFSLLEYLMFLVMADLASYTSTDKLRLFGGYYLLVRICTFAGTLLSAIDEGVLAFGGSYSLFGIVLAALMIVTSVWLVTEKNLTAFFWGNTPQELARVSAAAIPNAPATDASALAASPNAPATGPSAPAVSGAKASLVFVEPSAASPEDAAEADQAAIRNAVRRQTEVVARRFELTEREQTVLELMAMGRSSTFIAEELMLSSNTIRKRIQAIYLKCGVHSRQELLTLVQSPESGL